VIPAGKQKASFRCLSPGTSNYTCACPRFFYRTRTATNPAETSPPQKSEDRKPRGASRRWSPGRGLYSTVDSPFSSGLFLVLRPTPFRRKWPKLRTDLSTSRISFRERLPSGLSFPGTPVEERVPLEPYILSRIRWFLPLFSLSKTFPFLSFRFQRCLVSLIDLLHVSKLKRPPFLAFQAGFSALLSGPLSPFHTPPFSIDLFRKSTVPSPPSEVFFIRSSVIILSL